MNKQKLFAFAVNLSFALAYTGLAAAQDINMTPANQDINITADQSEPQKPEPLASEIFKHPGTVITPPGSLSLPGKAVHTNFKIFVPAGHPVSAPVADYNFAETPASLGCVYRVGPTYAGCTPSGGGTDHPVGGWGAIALVDAYDDPTAASDLAAFDSHFGLPAASFSVVYANSSFGTLNGLTASCSGTPPPAKSNYQWDIEESLDIEWSHAMAPSAKIILVEACTQNLPDLLFAEEVAGIEVSKYGGGDISNSWGYPESEVGNSGDGGGTMTEQQDDNFFFRYYWSNITYFASAGDSGAEVLFPSASPWVVSAGGTTVNRDVNGNFLNESCWSDSGGGFSTVEKWASPPSISNGMGPWANYQYQLFGQSFRSTPDISFNADPNSGVYVYDTDEGGSWYIVGGTSVSSPALAGIVNNANNRLGAAPTGGGYYETNELNFIYGQLNTYTTVKSNYYDVTTGSNGHAAGTGYDQCTGIGSPRGFGGK
ncbi:MAG: S53 family peptidase [Bryobacteraceae bacterium]